MSPALLAVLMAGMLALNLYLWKRRGRGWRTHVLAFVSVVQPYVPEPVVDAVVLQPAGAVGAQARAEQSRGLRTLFSAAGGELSGAVAEHRASEAADAEGAEGLPPMTALVVTASRRYLLPVVLADGVWSASPPERSWGAGEATYALSPRALTIQVTIECGHWTGAYETARDPARYSQTVLERLAASG